MKDTQYTDSSDFYAYDIPSDRVTSLSWDSTRQGGPSAGFTPRATIDPSLNELYVLGGLSRDKTAHTESLWVFNLDREKWTCIRQENMGYDPPCPRYGHQLVYDNQQRIHYLFGGNPGENGQSKERLDDFWELRLRRPDSQEVLRRATLMVRRQRFLEMCRSHQPTEALKFLQEELAEVVDHTKHEEEEEFRGLPTALFSQSRFSNDTPDQWVPTPVTEERIVFRQRTKLFRDLLALFPKDMREPEKSVLDLT